MAEYDWNALQQQAADHAKDNPSAVTAALEAVGKFDAEVVAAKADVTSNGKHRIGVKFKVTTPGPELGKTIWSNQYLSPESPAAMSIWFATFDLLGVHRSEWAGDVGGCCERVADRLSGSGAKAKIVTALDTYQGKTKTIVKYVNPATGATPSNVVAFPTPGVPSPAAPMAATGTDGLPPRPF